MTHAPARLYYEDAYQLTFTSTVTDVRPHGDAVAVTLTSSAFYPTSGGQLHDVGTLTPETEGPPAHVLDVIDGDDGHVWHVLDRALAPGTAVRGDIDPPRRADHRQQHTGQHVLSASFARTVCAETRSVHLGAEVCTLDLDREVTDDELAMAEADANVVVCDDRDVHVRMVDADAAVALPLRRPTRRPGTVRLVDIAGHDLSACGGTHVRRTGEIGAILVLGTERVRGGTRVTFVCGQRAVSSHRRLRTILDEAARDLSVGRVELPAAVRRLQDDLRTTRRTLDVAREQLAALEARSLAQAFEPRRGYALLVAHLDAADATDLRRSASTLVETPGRLVVLTGGPAPHALVVARSADLEGHDAGRLARALAAALGGKAGGRADFAQGGGVTASLADLRREVDAALA